MQEPERRLLQQRRRQLWAAHERTVAALQHELCALPVRLLHFSMRFGRSGVQNNMHELLQNCPEPSTTRQQVLLASDQGVAHWPTTVFCCAGVSVSGTLLQWCRFRAGNSYCAPACNSCSELVSCGRKQSTESVYVPPASWSTLSGALRTRCHRVPICLHEPRSAILPWCKALTYCQVHGSLLRSQHRPSVLRAERRRVLPGLLLAQPHLL